MNLPTDNTNTGMLSGPMGAQNLPMLQFYMDNYGMVPPQIQNNSGILNQRSAAAFDQQNPTSSRQNDRHERSLDQDWWRRCRRCTKRRSSIFQT